MWEDDDTAEERQQRGHRFFVFCPGCKHLHTFNTDVNNSFGAKWTWNGSYDKPGFEPSLRMIGGGDETLCHSFLRDGAWEFLGDSKAHGLRGFHPMIDIPKDFM